MLIRGNGRRLAVIFKAALPRSVHDGSYTLLHSGHLGATRHKFYRSRVTTDFRFIPRSHRHINSRTNSGVGLPTRVDSVYILVMGWCLFFKSVRYLLSVFQNTTYRWQRVGVNLAHWMRRTHGELSPYVQINVPNCSLLFMHAMPVTTPLETLTRHVAITDRKTFGTFMVAPTSRLHPRCLFFAVV